MSASAFAENKIAAAVGRELINGKDPPAHCVRAGRQIFLYCESGAAAHPNDALRVFIKRAKSKVKPKKELPPEIVFIINTGKNIITRCVAFYHASFGL